MKKIIAGVLCAFCILMNLNFPKANAAKFSDVNSKTKGYNEIMWASEMGIINGFSDGTFRPTESITRAQTAVMIWRLNGSPDVYGDVPFTDIGSCKPNVQKAILWAQQQGYVKGTGNGTTFNPDGTLTRQQMAIILYRMAFEPGAVGIPVPFKDIASCKATAKNAIKWAYAEDITKGTSATTFGPNENCTRAQFCIFLYRFVNRSYANTNVCDAALFWIVLPSKLMMFNDLEDYNHNGEHYFWGNYHVEDIHGETALSFSMTNGSYGIGGAPNPTHVRIYQDDTRYTDYYYVYNADTRKFAAYVTFTGTDNTYAGLFESNYLTPAKFFLIANTIFWKEPKG